MAHTPDTVTIKVLVEFDLKTQIAAAAIAWADAVEAEASLDERIPKRESNFTYRVTAAAKLQEIRQLVKELHSTQDQGEPRVDEDIHPA